MSEEIPYGTLPSRPVLASLVDVHDDVLSDDVDQVNSELREELMVPQIQNEPVTLPSSNVHNVEPSLTVDLHASASAREMSPTQHFVAHVDV